MIEFGAKLSLKDNMSATIQKNLKMQRQFSEQVKRTSNNVKELGKAKVAPVIQAKDKATATINKVRNSVKTVGKMVAKPFITVKDNATKAINKITSPLKKLGKTVAKPFIYVKDKASPIINKVKNGLKSIGSTTAKAGVAIKDGATAGLSKIGGMLGTLAKGATIAIGLAGAGATALLAGSLSEGANLQQSVGGVETLYKGDAGMVTANADKAFRTAGLSANAYMETVTSFSASLLQSVGGDTAKSAQIADMAIIDMADNANKFGTDMASIQNAYQGFAKQNYTMLDNLKLGYGGTQEEMARLLQDATKLTGVQYDMSNLSDVYSAIHVIQENMGVTGTTAKEASQTFSGSFASMKASISNLFGNMSLGGDITGSMQDVVETASTFLFDNMLPMVGNVFKALPTAISTAIKSASPKIKEAGGDIVKSLKEGLISLLPASMSGAMESAFGAMGNLVSTVAPLVQQIGDMFGRVAPVIADTLGDAFGEAGSLVNGFAGAVTKSIPIIEKIILNLSDTMGVIMPVLSSLGNVFYTVFPTILSVVNTAITAINPIFQSFSTHLQTLIPVITGIIQSFAGIIQNVFPIVSNIISTVIEAVMPKIQAIAELIQQAMPTIGAIIEGVLGAISTIFPVAWDIISPIIDVAITVIGTILEVVEAVFPVVQSIISDVWGFLEPIFGAIAEGLKAVGDAIGGVADFVSSGVDTIAGWFGFAYGKDRVPYDNYPAMLHQGEKVLTRNQADQYERVMNTRGVQLSTAEPVSAGGNQSATNTATPVQGEPKQEFNFSPTLNFAGANFNEMGDMEKIADQTIEIFMDRFRKIIPNMA